MSSSNKSVFYIKINGRIESGEFMHGEDLYFLYFFNYGADWEIFRGTEDGCSQITRRTTEDFSFVWNFPFDVTFKSTNPYGWPQLILCFYGSDFLGNDVIRGYTATHLPISPGVHKKRLRCFVPESASLLQKIASIFTGRRAEFVDPKIIAQPNGRELTRVRSEGEVEVFFDVIFKDFHALGYNASGQRAAASSKSDGIFNPVEKPEPKPRTNFGISNIPASYTPKFSVKNEIKNLEAETMHSDERDSVIKLDESMEKLNTIEHLPPVTKTKKKRKSDKNDKTSAKDQKNEDKTKKNEEDKTKKVDEKIAKEKSLKSGQKLEKSKKGKKTAKKNLKDTSPTETYTNNGYDCDSIDEISDLDKSLDALLRSRTKKDTKTNQKLSEKFVIKPDKKSVDLNFETSKIDWDDQKPSTSKLS